MSGFCAVLFRDGRPVTSDLLDNLNNALPQKGADRVAGRHDGPAGLVCRHLWTTPEACNDVFPVRDLAADLILTGWLRLDNRAHLLRALEFSPEERKAVGDGRLLLAAYKKWEEGCLDHLVGDYAFALWDGRRRRFFAARDPLGVRRLFVVDAPALWAGASDIAPLKVLPGVDLALDEVRLASYILQDFSDKGRTFYWGIRRLPPAHAVVAGAEGGRTWRTWAPDLGRQLRFRGLDEAAEAFKEVFNEAVAARTRSDQPIGSTLSGGLDSTSVATVAGRLLAARGEQLRTYSAIFPAAAEIDPRIDERPYIDAAVEAGGYLAERIVADDLNPLFDALWRGDEPLPGLNLYLDQAYLEAAAAGGVRVILTGHDGDSVVSHGTERLVQLALTGRWGTMLRETDHLARQYGVSRRRALWHYVGRPLLPVDRINRLRGKASGPNPAALLAPDFARRAVALGVDGKGERLPPVYKFRRRHWAGLSSGLFVYGTEALEQLAAPFPVEWRHPFLDRRLVEFCLALLLEYKFADGRDRVVVRLALADVLPPAVRDRRHKGNLSANFHRNLHRQAGDELAAFVARPPERLKEYIDCEELGAWHGRWVTNQRRLLSEGKIVSMLINLKEIL